MQVFITTHRDEIQDSGSDWPLSFHGLRHTYAAQKYKELTANGMGELDVHFAVSCLLGHDRPDVTNIYLVSLTPKKGAHR